MSSSATDTAAGDCRPLRADARRNRERVLEAARAAFAEYGHEAQIDDIAGRAKVGVGTVYRHFPTKEALAEALLVDSFERITAHARQSLEVADPWEALTAVLWFGAELLAANRGLTESLAAHPGDWKSSTETELRAAMAELIRRGEEAGVLRPGVVDDDIPMLMCGIGFAYRRPHVHPESWRRHLTVVIDGLRAGSASGQLPD
jgi:AcrR family transcriptional regulator